MSGVAAVPCPAEATFEPRRAEPVRVRVFEGFREAETLWRTLEESGAATPYQRFDWARAFVEAASPGADVKILAMLDGAGQPLALLPLAVERQAGLRIAAGIGGKHANFHLPLLAPGAGAGLAEGEMLGALRRAAATVGIDAYALGSVPRIWGDVSIPLTAVGTPSPSNAYEVRLERDPDATAHRSMSNEARKRLRNKVRGLAKLGEVVFLQARTEAEVDTLLAAFFAQKEDRFRDLGVTDPFAERGIRDFIRAASVGGLADGRPAIELYGLLVGEQVAAVLGGAADARRLSGMFISFAACQEITKYSPGDILVSHIVRDQCLRGRSFFDLGVGEARYKRTFCDDTVELVDVFLPVSLRGRGYALARRAVAGLKRRVKQNPHAMRLVAKLRRATAA